MTTRSHLRSPPPAPKASKCRDRFPPTPCSTGLTPVLSISSSRNITIRGHIPIKLVAFDTAVNVSVDLPIDRTSVDHGTAFDIAGKGIANHGNMNAAIAYARKLVAGKERKE